MKVMASEQLLALSTVITFQLLLLLLTCSTNATNHKSTTTKPRQQLKHEQQHASSSSMSSLSAQQQATRTPSKKPNIILFLTDDQDVELGSLNFMPKTLKNIRENGAEFQRAYATTPMCCPSRSSLLTGMYVHNHQVFTNKDNCSSPQWQATHETRSFATYLSNAGYRTGYFGKYLNKYNGTYIPPGWREWGGLIMNSKYYNYSVNMNGQKIKHGFEYDKDYYTDVITNDSITFLRNSKKQFPHKPLMLTMAFPAPHGPEDSAPQYSNLFFNITAHHTPSYDFAPNPDKQWILKVTEKMQPIHREFTDLLMTKRLQTLQSVDDAVERVIKELKKLDELDNTYIVYTSDHGYHLGQFGLIKGKSFPFEFDVRIPFLIRGPGILPGRILNDIVLNIDLAPTFLDMAGVEPPRHMDGRSILPLFANPKRKKKIKWPDTFLIESSGRRETPYLHTKQYQMGLLQYSVPFGQSTTMDNKNNTNLSRNQNETAAESKHKTDNYPYKWSNNTELLHSPTRIKRSSFSNPCETIHMKLPCRHGQKWYCQKEKGRWHRHRCKFAPPNNFIKSGRKCFCFTPSGPMYRNTEAIPTANQSTSDSIEIVNIFPECTVIKGEVKCSNILYQDEETWLKSRLKIDGEIYTLKQNLEQLKKIKKHLRYAKPRRKNTSNVNNTFKEHPHIDQMNTKYKIKSKEYKNQGNYFDKMQYNLRHRHRHQSITVENPVDVEIIRRSSFNPRLSKNFQEHINNNKKSKFLRNCYCEDVVTTETVVANNNNNNNENLESGSKTDVMLMSKEDKRRLKQQKKKEDECHFERMTCFEHNNDHWRTDPKWTSGPFCFCMNANNNTYSCLRTINALNDFLYCEFITGFVTFYNLKIDPSELKNRYSSLKPKDRLYLKELLKKMVACKGNNCSQQLDQTKFNLRSTRI